MFTIISNTRFKALLDAKSDLSDKVKELEDRIDDSEEIYTAITKLCRTIEEKISNHDIILSYFLENFEVEIKDGRKKTKVKLIDYIQSNKNEGSTEVG